LIDFEIDQPFCIDASLSLVSMDLGAIEVTNYYCSYYYYRCARKYTFLSVANLSERVAFLNMIKQGLKFNLTKSIQK